MLRNICEHPAPDAIMIQPDVIVITVTVQRVAPAWTPKTALTGFAAAEEEVRELQALLAVQALKLASEEALTAEISKRIREVGFDQAAKEALDCRDLLLGCIKARIFAP